MCPAFGVVGNQAGGHTGRCGLSGSLAGYSASALLPFLLLARWPFRSWLRCHFLEKTSPDLLSRLTPPSGLPGPCTFLQHLPQLQSYICLILNPALLTFGARWSFDAGGCCVHGRRFNSIPGLDTRESVLPHQLREPQISPDLARCPRGARSPILERWFVWSSEECCCPLRDCSLCESRNMIIHHCVTALRM